MTRAGRVIVLALVVGAVFGLSVHYAAADAARPSYVGGNALQSDYEAHVGERTLLFATVVSVSSGSDTATVSVPTDRGPLELTVRGFDVTVQPGGVVQVFGTVRPDRTVGATNVAVVNPAGSSTTYKYAVSAVGALLVLGQFFRHWRFDAGALAFEVRDRG